MLLFRTQIGYNLIHQSLANTQDKTEI